MPPVKLDSFLRADVINGSVGILEMTMERALADGRLWGQCLLADLNTFESTVITQEVVHQLARRWTTSR